EAIAAPLFYQISPAGYGAFGPFGFAAGAGFATGFCSGFCSSFCSAFCAVAGCACVSKVGFTVASALKVEGSSAVLAVTGAASALAAFWFCHHLRRLFMSSVAWIFRSDQRLFRSLPILFRICSRFGWIATGTTASATTGRL